MCTGAAPASEPIPHSSVFATAAVLIERGASTPNMMLYYEPIDCLMIGRTPPSPFTDRRWAPDLMGVREPGDTKRERERQ